MHNKIYFKQVLKTRPDTQIGQLGAVKLVEELEKIFS